MTQPMTVSAMCRVLSTPHLGEGRVFARGTVSLLTSEERDVLVIVDDISGKDQRFEIVKGSFKRTETVPGNLFEKLSDQDRERWTERCFLLTWKPNEKTDAHAVGYRDLPVTAATIRTLRVGASATPTARVK